MLLQPTSSDEALGAAAHPPGDGAQHGQGPDRAFRPYSTVAAERMIGPMSIGSGRLVVTNPAVLLATGSSCAVIAAAALDVLTPPVVAGALAAAAAITVLRHREHRSSVSPHVLTPLQEDPRPVAILAPNAAETVAARHRKADAA